MAGGEKKQEKKEKEVVWEPKAAGAEAGAPKKPGTDPQKEAPPLSGLRKAAILLLSLDQETAGKIFSVLSKGAMEQLTLEIARIDEVKLEEREKVLEEFTNLSLARTYVEQGGIEYARRLLERALPLDEAMRILETVKQTIQAEPFEFLRKSSAEMLLPFLQNEHPQTIALVMAYLPSATAAEVLGGLPIEKRLEVVRRLATIEQTSPEIITQVEKVLEKRFSSTFVESLKQTEGIKLVAEILNRTDRATEKSIFETIEEDSPELAEKIHRLMFVFEDLLLADDKGIQNLLKDINTSQLAMALRVASDDLKGKFFKNMSKRAGELLKEEMEYMGPVRLSEVESAQQAIVEKVRSLEESGQLFIQGRGGTDQVLV